VRSSRRLEEATRVRVDFMWLLQGLTIDHATVAKFRTRFEAPLKALFRQVNRQALRRVESQLVELIFDGTRVRANSDRQGARPAAWLAQKVEEIQQQLEAGLTQLGTPDRPADVDLASPAALAHHVAGLRAELAQYERALAVARERDETKRSKDGPGATPVRVPITDPDAYVLPNKEGGYAPNYTPVVAVDGASGLIVAAAVLPDSSEAAAVQPLVEAVRQDHEVRPQRVLFDRGFASGTNQAELAQQGIAVYAPVDSPTGAAHPAQREDPSQPLPPERLAVLPRVETSGKFDRQAFLYDPGRDVYWCPLGRPLCPARRMSRQTAEGPVAYTEYQCRDCEHCPLAAGRLSRGARQRRLNRDQFEPVREQTARRLATPEGKAIYRRRAPVAEGTFAGIKSAMGIRRFLLRGLAKVRTEWLWICTAFNLGKLLRFLGANDPNGPTWPTPPDAPGTHAGRAAPLLFGARQTLALIRALLRFAAPGLNQPSGPAAWIPRKQSR
jgi:hypothetical protein